MDKKLAMPTRKSIVDGLLMESLLIAVSKDEDQYDIDRKKYQDAYPQAVEDVRKAFHLDRIDEQLKAITGVSHEIKFLEESPFGQAIEKLAGKHPIYPRYYHIGNMNFNMNDTLYKKYTETRARIMYEVELTIDEAVLLAREFRNI
jgi:hypothetical protein